METASEAHGLCLTRVHFHKSTSLVLPGQWLGSSEASSRSHSETDWLCRSHCRDRAEEVKCAMLLLTLMGLDPHRCPTMCIIHNTPLLPATLSAFRRWGSSCVLVIPATGRQRQEEASLGYTQITDSTPCSAVGILANALPLKVFPVWWTHRELA